MRPEPTKHVPIAEDESAVTFSLTDLLVYFLRLGTFGFGGPIALADHMQKDLVKEFHAEPIVILAAGAVGVLLHGTAR